MRIVLSWEDQRGRGVGERRAAETVAVTYSTAGLFILRCFLGAARALLVAAGGPVMELRHCFLARPFPAGLGRVFSSILSFICSRSPHRGDAEESVFCSEAVRRSKTLARGHCLVARPGALCPWILLMAVTCHCFLPMGGSLWRAASPQGSLPRFSAFPNTFRNKETPGSPRISERWH